MNKSLCRVRRVAIASTTSPNLRKPAGSPRLAGCPVDATGRHRPPLVRLGSPFQSAALNPPRPTRRPPQGDDSSPVPLGSFLNETTFPTAALRSLIPLNKDEARRSEVACLNTIPTNRNQTL